MNLKICVLLFLSNSVTAGILAEYVFEDNLNGKVANAPDIEYLRNSTNYEIGTIQNWPVNA